MNAFSRSWMITRLTFQVINRDRELLWFALLSFIFSTVFAIAMIFPSVVPAILSRGLSHEALRVDEYVVIFLTYFGLAFIATFFNVCVVYTAKRRFEGKNATFGESLRFAFSKMRLILQWSLLSATIGLLLRVLHYLASHLGKVGEILANILISLMGMAWSILTIFVVPALVYDGLGAINALKKSSDVIKKTWGESLIKTIGVGLIQFAAITVILVATVGITALLVTAFDLTGLIIGVSLGILMALLAGLIFSVASMIFNTALYVYANDNIVASGFSEDIMKSAFTQK